MEFIPLERSGSKTKKKEFLDKKKSEEKKKHKENDGSPEVLARKGKLKPQTRVFEKKKVKNKYKETLALKQKKRVPKKKTPEQKQKEQEEEEEEEEEVVDDDDDDDDEQVDDENEMEEEVSEQEQNEEEIYKRKCKEMDEKKKNRLFVKLRKKILNEAQIKELHPDIRSVIFPRKKNSRWCWAVFTSEEKASAALEKLIKNKDVIVSKPTPYDKVDKKNKEKMKTVLRKKEGRKKLQKMWM